MLKPDKKKKKQNGGQAQGISASGNALHRVVMLAAMVAIIPLIGAFAYILLAREPGLQNAQIAQVTQSYALQQATSVSQLITQIDRRITAAAKSPLALQSIASTSSNDIALVEQAMLDYFPEVLSLRLLPLGDMGTADFTDGNQGLRNHIEVDLVRLTGEGEATPPESYQFEGQWVTSVARLVSHPRQATKKAVMIVTISNDVLTNRLQLLGQGQGKSTLKQIYQPAGGAATTAVIARAGSATAEAERFSRSATLPNTSWQVTFTPSEALLSQLSFSRLPSIITLVICLIGVLASLGLIAILYPRALNNEVQKVISLAERKAPIQLSVPELVSIAKQLRRATLRSLREGPGATPTAPVLEFDSTASAELSNPMFHKDSILDEEEEVLDLDLSSAPEPEAVAAVQEGFPGHIFRAYDIRGLAEEELNDEMITRIGGAIATKAKQLDQQTLIVACDGRHSSPRIKAALIKALMAGGRDIIDIGLVPTPLLYFATRHLNCGSGIMVTGSHNPGDYNGLKIVLNQQTIAAGGIQELRELALGQKFASGTGRMIREDIVPAYIDEVVSDIAITMPLKVVVDAGNGATSLVAPGLFEELGCEVIPLYCEIDGRFPNHPPDTSNEENLVDLVAAVKAQNADFGVAFDGDGDRVAVVTGAGHIVRSDVLMMVFAEDVVSRNPGADVVFDVKCSRNLAQLITRHGGRPVLWKTGHAFMKEKMIETGALLGGEFSGHVFFGERWYGFDDGMYAAGRLAEILSTHGETLDDAIASFPQTVNTPEILVPVDERRKFKIVEQFAQQAEFVDGKVNTLDGVRVDFAQGWGLIRASNTTAALTARFEASDQSELDTIKQVFSSQLLNVDPDLDLDF
ncbi:MAG: phosphomannomutase/phosphoglucomutase [Halioglobus sp.]